jgi:hypothetical protein
MPNALYLCLMVLILKHKEFFVASFCNLRIGLILIKTLYQRSLLVCPVQFAIFTRQYLKLGFMN